jgi:quercetin dioxygenase-like cupin family protein
MAGWPILGSLQHRTAGAVVVIAIAIATVAAPIALANTSAVLAARARLSDSVVINQDRMKFQTKGPTDFQMQTITFSPGGDSGWHHHPGIIWVLVEQGAITIYDENCQAVKTVSAGNVFTEGGPEPMIVRNEGVGDAIVYNTQVAPAGEPFRINDYTTAPAPCTLPSP